MANVPIKWVGADPSNYAIGDHKISDAIVFHWMVGTIASADQSFNNPARRASAQYGIADKEIHQYVSEFDIAFANGHRDPSKNYNPHCISIEHEGGWLLPDGTRAKPTHQVHENSAHLCVDIVRRHPQIKLDRQHFLKHKEVSDTGTQCCGSLDVDWILNRTKQLLQGGYDMNIEKVVDDMIRRLMGKDPHTYAERQQKVDYLNNGGDVGQLAEDFIRAANLFYAADKVVDESYIFGTGQPASPDLKKQKSEALGGGFPIHQLITEVDPHGNSDAGKKLAEVKKIVC